MRFLRCSLRYENLRRIRSREPWSIDRRDRNEIERDAQESKTSQYWVNKILVSDVTDYNSDIKYKEGGVEIKDNESRGINKKRKIVDSNSTGPLDRFARMRT